MKNKFILTIALAATALVSSCDMDKEPYNALPDATALQTPTNFESARVGLYSAMKASTAGSFYNAPEIQADCFNAVTGFSNTYGDMYRWDFDAQSSTFETIYGNLQALISRANFIIDSYDMVADINNKNIFDADGLKATKEVKGDAFWMRAYAIFSLSQYFCQDYEESTASNPNTGVSYTLHYDPSEDASTYPGRETLAATYKQVLNDLDSAAVYVTTAGKKNSPYVTVDAITALRARVALAMDDYDLAFQEAQLLIHSDSYSLASDQTELQNLWQTSATIQGANAGGSEAIMVLNATSSNELPAQTGTYYLPYNAGSVPDYIPTQAFMDLYSDYDYRKAVYFTKVDITTNTGGVGSVYALNKYPDQGILYRRYRQESARFATEPRVFRIAEMYLIAAEASAMSGDLGTAAYYLDELERKRIAGHTDKHFANQEAFMQELRNERAREMVAEGSRLFDLKRWHLGVQRGNTQQRDLCLLPGANTTDLNMPSNSNRLVWPIPKHEKDVNPNIQQNPGY